MLFAGNSNVTNIKLECPSRKYPGNKLKMSSFPCTEGG